MRKMGTALAVLTLLGALASCASQAAAPTPAPAPAPTAEAKADYQTAYAVEKLNEVNDMVLARKAVPADYLAYLDEETAQAVEEYNSATVDMRDRYIWMMNSTAEVLAYAYGGGKAPDESVPDSARFLTEGDRERYYAFIDRAATLALYRNVGELMQTDPATAYPATVESGGSYGLWATDMLHTALVDDDLRQSTQDYLDQVDALLERFDAARAGLSE